MRRYRFSLIAYILGLCMFAYPAEAHHVHRHHIHHHHRHHLVVNHYDRGGLSVTPAVTIPLPRAADRDPLHRNDIAMQGSPDRLGDLRSVNSAVIPLEPMVLTTPNPTEGDTTMDWVDFLWKGFALFGIAAFVWYVGKFGWTAVTSGMSKMASVAKTDFVALEARVKILEGGGPPSAKTPLPAAGSSTG